MRCQVHPFFLKNNINSTLYYYINSIFKLTLHSDAVFSPRYPRPVTFQSEFLTTKGQWSEITVPFATLQASFRGRRMEKTFNPKIVKSVGIILADKMQGDFEIDLDWIKAV